MKKTLVLKFTGKEMKYFDELSNSLGMPKGFMISQASKWLEIQLKNNKSYELDLSDDSDKYTNPLMLRNIVIDEYSQDLLKRQAKKIGVTRYQLVRALIKKVPDLLISNQFYSMPIETLKYK